ncbi:hypothetical protein NDN08_007439 [Rhodosorus marinus]|uniref:Peroxisomal ATPase PEX6 n=1 Tax=Rhodosorus marinus TaxID=101924 RepID=A0AAV8UXJ7_9RHOD|nr:hypothetical protein NDN08_007439 [Rhodosorus marinus]
MVLEFSSFVPRSGGELKSVKLVGTALPLECWEGLGDAVGWDPSAQVVTVGVRVLRELCVISGRNLVISSEKSDLSRVARVVASETLRGGSGEALDAAFLSPALAASLGVDLESASVLTLRAARAEEDAVEASWAKFSLLRDGKNPSNFQVTSAALRRYLRTPKTFAKNDVIAVLTAAETLGNEDEENGGTEESFGSLEDDPTYSTFTKINFFRLEDIKSKQTACSSEAASHFLITGDTTVEQGPASGGRRPAGILDVCRYMWKDQLRPRTLEMPSSEPIVSKVKQVISGNLRGVRSSILVYGQRGSGKMRSSLFAAEMLGCSVVELNCLEAAFSETVVSKAVAHASLSTPSVLILSHVAAIVPMLGLNEKAQSTRAMQTNAAQRTYGRLRRLLVGDTNLSADRWHSGWDSIRVDQTSITIVAIHHGDVDDLEPEFRAQFTFELESDTPNLRERERLIAESMQRCGLAEDYAGYLASQLAGRSVDEVYALMRDASARAMRDNHPLRTEHLNQALLRAQQAAGSDAAKAVKVSWEDVGGLSEAKSEIVECIELPLRKPELFASSMKRRSGLLFYGPPGTGKTLLAKAVASECGCSFISVKGPELMNMYVGESERNVRDVFNRARLARPCVVFFDELDALAPSRGRGADSGGVSDRIVSQLLAEVDGLDSNGGEVFVIGATNRPDLIDTGLLRPGRFDRLVFIGTPDTREAQFKVLEALTRKFRLRDDVDLMKILDECPEPPLLSGADFYGLASSSWLAACKRTLTGGPDNRKPAEEVKKRPRLFQEDSDDEGQNCPQLEEEEARIIVTQEDFLMASKELTPSLTTADIARYYALRDNFQGRAK